jgi:molybdopterin molybdotransferase
MFIPTGGFLPAGADAVIMQEDTSREEDAVVTHKAVEAMENVQRRAEDFTAGGLLYRESHRLRPQDIATLATFGIAEVQVVRRPAIGIISTGNELVEFHTNPAAGQIRETNALALSDTAHQFGFHSHRFGIVRDRFEDQKEALTKALSAADVVLISGGSSVGERDYTLDVIRSFPDSKILFHGLAIRPGNPTIFARVGDKSIFGLPGQPVSSLIVFYQFVLPFLFHLAGEQVDYSRFSETKLASVRAGLDRDVQPLKMKTDYLRLRLRQTSSGWSATPVPGKSASLSTLAFADGFTILDPGDRPIPSGTPVTVLLFP